MFYWFFMQLIDLYEYRKLARDTLRIADRPEKEKTRRVSTKICSFDTGNEDDDEDD